MTSQPDWRSGTPHPTGGCDKVIVARGDTLYFTAARLHRLDGPAVEAAPGSGLNPYVELRNAADPTDNEAVLPGEDPDLGPVGAQGQGAREREQGWDALAMRDVEAELRAELTP